MGSLSLSLLFFFEFHATRAVEVGHAKVDVEYALGESWDLGYQLGTFLTGTDYQGITLVSTSTSFVLRTC
jgi:hypothetical protein